MAAPIVPSSVFELVQGGSDFTFNGWANALSRVPLFRIVGVRRVLTAVGIPPSDLMHCLWDVQTATLRMVPDQWKSEFEPTNKSSAWAELGRPQLPKAGKSDFQVFDSACLSVLYIANFLHALGDRLPDDYFDQVRIVPITYGIGGLTDGFFEREVKGTPFLLKLQRSLHARRQSNVAEVALSGNGRISLNNAEIVHSMISAQFPQEDFTIQKPVTKPCTRSIHEDLELSVRSDLPRRDIVSHEDGPH